MTAVGPLGYQKAEMAGPQMTEDLVEEEALKVHGGAGKPAVVEEELVLRESQKMLKAR